MTPEIELQIETVGQQVLAALPEGFKTAWLYGEAEEGVYSAYVFCRLPDEKVYCKGTASELRGAVYKLWKLARRAGPSPWSTITMTLQPDGKFTVDYTFENLQEVTADDAERRDAWLQKYTGSTAVIYPPMPKG